MEVKLLQAVPPYAAENVNPAFRHGSRLLDVTAIAEFRSNAVRYSDSTDGVIGR